MVFGAKKEAREPPVDRVRAMMRAGMSEKDIVRQLKAEGFSFGEIEKALMAVVKAGAAPLPPGAELGVPQRAPPRAMPPAMPVAAAPPQAPPAAAPPVYQPEYPAYQPEYPPAPAYAEEYAQPEELQPEVIIEELIESVAEEKFEKFALDIKRLDDELEKLRDGLAVARERAEAKPAPEIPKELGDHLDSLDVRIGGLEKAFKQLLPQLTEHVQAISKIVAEKRRQQPPTSFTAVI